MSDLTNAKRILTEGAHTCVLCWGDAVYTADDRGVKPLVDWLDSGLDLRGFSAADKVVGRATAFLYVLLGVKEVHSLVMSTPAKEALTAGGIAATCDREVPGIINRRGDGPCPFEDAVLGITDPMEALTAIRKKQLLMRQPPEIAAHTKGKDFTIDSTGLSGSTVAIFEEFVLKSEPVSEESENGLAMLRWLDGKIPAPRVLESVILGGFRWTLMTRISGEMSCADAHRADPHRLTRVLADAMKRLWTVDVSGCPVDQSPAAKLARARKIVEAGDVNMDLVDPETFGENGFSSPDALLQWLQENAPDFEPVLTHGDYCLPNVFLENWEFSGFLDLGRSGAGDKWTDIAILWRSLRDNFGGHYGEAVALFHPDELFDALGMEKDERKLTYYLLMDELF
ncbi:MAG: APH(3') family aminoglycoside O-phosphotransferase [Oscillospiraceae bacterium]|nr:APH(3') family aminoglycoside O-phosphotransferase [Oscillospiraceae bacterium]